MLFDANGLPTSSAGDLHAWNDLSEEERLALQDAVARAVAQGIFVQPEDGGDEHPVEAANAELAKLAVEEARRHLGQERFAQAIHAGEQGLFRRGLLEVVGRDELGREIVKLNLMRLYLADFSMPPS